MLVLSGVFKKTKSPSCIFTSVGTTRGQEIIRVVVMLAVVVVTFSFFGRFLK